MWYKTYSIKKRMGRLGFAPAPHCSPIELYHLLYGPGGWLSCPTQAGRLRFLWVAGRNPKEWRGPIPLWYKLVLNLKVTEPYIKKLHIIDYYNKHFNKYFSFFLTFFFLQLFISQCTDRSKGRCTTCVKPFFNTQVGSWEKSTKNSRFDMAYKMQNRASMKAQLTAYVTLLI